MAADIQLDPARTAVLSMDLQAGIVAMYAGGQDTLIQRAAGVLQHCREKGIRVIHVRVGFRAGLPEVSERNRLFGAIRNSPQHQKLFDGEAGAIHPALGPAEGDIVVTKHRVSAFAGTDLEMILRANGIETLVMFGLATSGVVLSTLLDASDADYRLVVVKDCCGDLDPDLHTGLMEKLFPRRAAVVTSEELLAAVSA